VGGGGGHEGAIARREKRKEEKGREGKGREGGTALGLEPWLFLAPEGPRGVATGGATLL
jgi:hypothetical protein